MVDTRPPPAPSRTLVFVRRSGSTVFLWAMVAWVFMSRYSWAYLALIGALTVIATVEFFRMLRAADVKCFPRFGILMAAGYCGALYATYLTGWVPTPGLDALAIFICLTGSFALQLRQPIRGLESLVAVAVNLLGFVYIAWLFNFVARLVFLIPNPPLPNDNRLEAIFAQLVAAGAMRGQLPTPAVVSAHGAYLLLWLLAVTKFTDMGAYITGSLIGRHKMIPHVSPGKTWEGFGGALIFSQLAGCGLYLAFPAELSILHSWGHVLALGLLLALLAVIGDLAESVLKRALDAKDSGRMLPGIGGALDLIDSLCFTAPALYFYLKWLLLSAA